ncbi:phage portal protein [Paracoccus sp. SSK6]|uniref:phage portal protein n=1 Tax=Paracoccus sp. SSK6 TaxID=3143131 RepID=UPI003219C658
MAWPFNRSTQVQAEEPRSIVKTFSDFFGWFGYGSGAAPALTAHQALDTAAVLCAVRVIAEGMGQMPLRLIRTEDIDGRERTSIAKDYWAHKLLAVRPNSFQTSSEFIESMVINAALGKGALAIKNIVGDQVRELLPVPSGSWAAEIDDKYRVFYRVTFVGGHQQVFSQEQCLFIKGVSLDGLEGISAIERARKVIGISSALEDQQLKISYAGGRPSGVLTFEHELKPETKQLLAETWKARWGAGGEGGIAVLDGNAKFSPITLSMADSQFIENRRFQIEEIARVFRVQPIMLMQADKAATYASAEQFFRMHVTHTLGPWIRRIEAALHRDILQYADDLHFDFDEAELLRGDHTTQANYFSTALGKGGAPSWMSVNEVRKECGLDPLAEDWADKPSRGGYAEVAEMTDQPSNEQNPPAA